MKDLFIPANSDFRTPLVDFKTTGKLIISGESISSNPVSFYEPVQNWLQDFRNTNPKEIVLTMAFDYFNTSSSKIFYGLFKLLETFQSEDLVVKVNWVYDASDSEMLQTGIDYSSMVKIPFEMKEA